MEKMRNRANIISLITTIRNFSNAGDVKDGGNVFLWETILTSIKTIFQKLQ